jgi:predicted MFS family arabinose efflux permease
MSRYWLIVVCFLINAIGLIWLAESQSLWNFWASSILLSGVGVSLGIGQSLVTDLVTSENLSSALSWYGIATSTGGILGFLLAGYAFQGLGTQATLWGGALLTCMAVMLILRVQRRRLAFSNG